jgi:hypothetical protein
MTTLASISSATWLVYGASLVLVMWAVYDIARRPVSEMPAGRKTAWIVGSAVGWFFLGIAGACVAIVYLVGPRRRLNARRCVMVRSGARSVRSSETPVWPAVTVRLRVNADSARRSYGSNSSQ